jgi:hypothetical protein
LRRYVAGVRVFGAVRRDESIAVIRDPSGHLNLNLNGNNHHGSGGGAGGGGVAVTAFTAAAAKAAGRVVCSFA